VKYKGYEIHGHTSTKYKKIRREKKEYNGKK